MMMKTYFSVLRRDDSLLCLFITNRGRHWQYLVGDRDQIFVTGGDVMVAGVMGAKVAAMAGRSHHASS